MKPKIGLEIFSLCMFYLKLNSLSNPPTCSLSGLLKGAAQQEFSQRETPRVSMKTAVLV